MTQDLENSTKRLALPEQFSDLTFGRMLDVCFAALLGWLPFCGSSSWVGHALLLECTDLAIQQWEVKKRKLSLKHQRREQPLPLTPFERYTEFVRIPRVKLVLRNILYVAYLCAFVLLFLTQIELTDHKCAAWSAAAASAAAISAGCEPPSIPTVPAPSAAPRSQLRLRPAPPRSFTAPRSQLLLARSQLLRPRPPILPPSALPPSSSAPPPLHPSLTLGRCDSEWAPRVDWLLHLFSLWTFAIGLDELHSAFFSFDDWHRSFWNILDVVSLLSVSTSLAMIYYGRFSLDGLSIERYCGDDDGPQHALLERLVGRERRALRDGSGGGHEATDTMLAEHDGHYLTGIAVLSKPELLLGLAAIPMFMRLLHSFTADRKMGVLIVIIQARGLLSPSSDPVRFPLIPSGSSHHAEDVWRRRALHASRGGPAPRLRHRLRRYPQDAVSLHPDEQLGRRADDRLVGRLREGDGAQLSPDLR